MDDDVMELGALVEPFPAYYRASSEVWQDAYTNGVFVLDANALLDLYRLSPAARADYLAVLRALKEQLFVPYQVALEFHRRRADAVAGRIAEFDAQRRELEAQFNAARGVVNQVAIRSHGGPGEGQAVIDALGAAFAVAREFVANAEAEYDIDPDTLLSAAGDPVLLELGDILNGRVARKPEAATLEEDLREAQTRVQGGRPPGHKDAGKSDGGVGDYLWWAETLRFAASQGRPLVVVTNDVGKGDWMFTQRGFRIGLSPELVDEARALTDKPVLTRTTSELLAEAAQFLDVPVSARTVDEANTLPSSELGTRNEVPREWVRTISGVPDSQLDEWVSDGLLPAAPFWDCRDVRRAAVLRQLADRCASPELKTRVIEALAERPQGHTYLVQRDDNLVWLRSADWRKLEQQGSAQQAVVTLKGVEATMRRRQAGLLQQTQETSIAPAPTNDYTEPRRRWLAPAPGEVVVHRKWGRGVVQETLGEGRSQEAVVAFDAVGDKRLLLAWAPLRYPYPDEVEAAAD